MTGKSLSKYTAALAVGLAITFTGRAFAQVTLDFDGFQWVQENCPNTGTEITSGTHSGASFNIASNDVTGSVAFAPVPTGGSFDDQVGVLATLIGDTASGTRAVNLPYGANVGQAIDRRGLSLGWLSGTIGGGGAALTTPTLPNGPGDDLIIFESGDPGQPDGMMVRFHVANALTPHYTDWYFAAPASEHPGTPILHAYIYDLSDLGLSAGAQVDLIQIANIVTSDRIDESGTYIGPGTPYPGTPYQPGMGVFGGAAELTGNGDFGTFQDALFDVGQSGTLNFWVKMDDTGKRNQFFEGPGNAGMEMQYRNNGGGQFYGRVNTGGDFAIQSGGAAGAAGVWTNLQYTWDATLGEMRVYVNGTEVTYLGSFDPPQSGFTPGTATDTTAGIMYVGRDPGDPARDFDGLMDDIGWFNGVLDSTDRDAIRTGGVAALSLDPRLVAHWDLDEVGGFTEADNKNGIVLTFVCPESIGWVAEGSVEPEEGGCHDMNNPGPDPGPNATFDIPFGNNTFDPDPLYIAVFHDLQELNPAAPPDLVLAAADCQDDAFPGEAGYQIAVTLSMENLPQNATGFQAFLEYDTGALSYRGDLSTYTNSPFPQHIQPIAGAELTTGELNLDGSDSFGGTGTNADSLLATLVFDVNVECTIAAPVSFRVVAQFDSELSFQGTSLPTDLVNAPAISADDTNPAITCPADLDVECDGAGNAAQLAAWLADVSSTDNCGASTIGHDFTALSDDCAATGSAMVTFTATDDCGNQSSCMATFTIQDTTDPAITCPANVSLECDEPIGPSTTAAQTGAGTGGISIYYNTTGPQDLSNAAYLRTQVSLANLNGAELFFDTAPLIGTPGVSWESVFSGQAPLTQFGLDLIRPLPTDDSSIAIPTLTAVENVNGTPGGATPAGTVSWAINDYKPNSPIGPTTPSNAPANSHIRGPAAGDPLVDIEIVELSLSGTTLTFSAKLDSDDFIHWYTVGTPDTPAASLGLNGDFYVSGTLELDSSAAGVDHYAGAMTLVANAPTATGIALATDGCTLFPTVTFNDDFSGLTGCDGTGTIQRTWTATDECNNDFSCVQTLTIVDTTPPEITCPAAVTVECDESLDPLVTGVHFFQGFEDDRDGWFDFGGTLSRVPSGDNGVTSADGSWHAVTDGAFTRWGGYSSIFPAGGYRTLVDIYLDVDLGAPNDSRFDYSSAVNNPAGDHRRDFIFNGGYYDSSDVTGPGAGLNRFIFAASNNAPGFPKGGVAPIAITTTGWYTFEHVFYDSGGGVLACDFSIYDAGGTLVVTWTRSDPADIIGSTVGGNRYGWFLNMPFSLAIDNTSLVSGATATDNCDPAPVVTYSDVISPGGCDQEVTITRTWLAEDGCGNMTTCEQLITLEDTTPPEIAPCPANITVNADAGGCTAEVSYATPTATDNCDPAPVVSCDFPSGTVFPTGTTLVTCTATDGCSNQDSCSFNVTVQALNEVDVEVELVGVHLPTSRCIHFTTNACGSTADAVLNFADHDGDDANTNGIVDATEGGSDTPSTPVRAIDTVEVPCGIWTQLCAKDEQHTLISTTSLSDPGTVYTADMLISLQGGDTDNDSDVDIHDVTWLLFTFGDLAVNGGCPWDGLSRDADFSNNGAVGSEDYSFLTANWLQFTTCNCTLSSVPGPGRKPHGLAGAASIEATLLAPQMAAKLDANRDGVFDHRDVKIFEERNGLSHVLSSSLRTLKETGNRTGAALGAAAGGQR